MGRSVPFGVSCLVGSSPQGLFTREFDTLGCVGIL